MIDEEERAARRRLRKARRNLDAMQSEWAEVVFVDDDDGEPDWGLAAQLDSKMDDLRSSLDEIEKEVRSKFGDQKQAKRRQTRRGRTKAPANPGFDRPSRDFQLWLKKAIEKGVIAAEEVSELAQECSVSEAGILRFAGQGEGPQLKGSEILRIRNECQRYFDYRLFGERSAISLLIFMFWYQEKMGITDAELSRLTRLNLETLRKWRSGENEPNLLSVLSCFDSLELELVPVPKSPSKRFLSVGFASKASQKRISISERWSVLTVEDVDKMRSFSRAFRELTSALRERWNLH